MSKLAALLFSALTALPATAAPIPSPIRAADVLDQVRRPGKSAALVNVWASWCGPCREEFPDLLHVAKELAPRGLRVILVSVDNPGDESDATDFLTSQGVDFQTYRRVGKDEDFVDGLERQWSGAIPATFLYDANGKLVRFWEGKASYPVMKKRALEALGTTTKEKP